MYSRDCQRTAMLSVGNLRGKWCLLCNHLAQIYKGATTMFVIGQLLTGSVDSLGNAIFILPFMFGILYLINLLLVRTVLGWLSKIKVIGIIIFVVYCLLTLFFAIGMSSMLGNDQADFSTYGMMAVMMSIAIFSINYFSYTPMFKRSYYGGGYETRYSHTEHHIFSPDVDWYVEEWHDWKESGARIASRISTFVALGIVVASLILNVWIVVGGYTAIRLVRHFMGKDDDDLSWNT